MAGHLYQSGRHRPNWTFSSRIDRPLLAKISIGSFQGITLHMSHIMWLISYDSYCIMTQYKSCSRQFLKARRDLTFYCEILPFLSFPSNHSVARFVIFNTNLVVVIIAAASKFQFLKKKLKISKKIFQKKMLDSM